jgi:hypothetical protein
VQAQETGQQQKLGMRRKRWDHYQGCSKHDADGEKKARRTCRMAPELPAERQHSHE